MIYRIFLAVIVLKIDFFNNHVMLLIGHDLMHDSTCNV